MNYDLSRVLFSIGESKFRCEEFKEALKFFGVYDDWCEQIQRGVYLKKLADDSGISPDLEILTEMTNEFRYSQKLLSSEDFHVWLEAAGLEFNDFEGYLQRQYWSDRSEDSDFEPSEIDDRKFFAELYFSGAFEGLLFSWQQRLLAWKEVKDEKFPGLEDLALNFESFKEEMLEHFEPEVWLKCFSSDLEYLHLECLLGDFEVLNKIPLEDFSKVNDESVTCEDVCNFRDQFPSQMRDYLNFVSVNEIFGPVAWENSHVLCKVVSIQKPSIEDEEVVEQLKNQFRAEVWKTLKFKYVR